MQRVMTITWTGIKQMLKDPLFMMFFLAMPVMMTWLMGFLPREMAGLASSGVMVIFIGLNLINSAGTILEERQQGTWGRLLAAPAAAWEIYLGYVAKLFVMGWVQAILLLAAGRYLFGFPWRGTIDLVWVLAAYILAMSGLGLLLAGFLRSHQQIPVVSTGLVMVGTMLGGVFFPVNTNSPVMVAIARISPQGWAARAINDLLSGGSDLAAVSGPILWLLGLGGIFMAVGIYRMGFDRG